MLARLSLLEKLVISKDTRVEMGYAHGLLYAFNSLYVMVNNRPSKQFPKTSGLYRLQDTDGDDQFDKVTLMRELKGEGEHGPHSIVLSPDKQSLYVARVTIPMYRRWMPIGCHRTGRKITCFRY